MNDMIQILDNQIQIKEWAGQRVVTFLDIDTVHKRARGTASRNFRENRDKFIEGTDFFQIPVRELPTNFVANPSNGGNPNNLMTLITESGYLMIVKSLHDDLAWAVQRALVNTYFKAKEDAAQVEETTVAVVNHETLTKCASIMASCLEPNRPYVLNILRHIIPDIDQTPTVTVQVEDKPIEIPQLPAPETAVVTNTKRKSSKYPYFNNMKLKALMKERKLTNSELAQRIGVDISTVSTWRSGYCPPTGPNRKKLCKALGVSKTYFDK